MDWKARICDKNIAVGDQIHPKVIRTRSRAWVLALPSKPRSHLRQDPDWVGERT